MLIFYFDLGDNIIIGSYDCRFFWFDFDVLIKLY